MFQDVKSLLDYQILSIKGTNFIENDPISIPHRFKKKEDIEIAGFLAAILAWGQRKQIILKANLLIDMLDNDPFDFLMNAKENDFLRLRKFVYRTFNGDDCHSIVTALASIYREKGGLERVFNEGFQNKNIFESIIYFRKTLLSYPHDEHSSKHIANPQKGSAAKRINMFLRWMIRKDDIDFGLWKNISPADLVCPLDVHSGRAARALNILLRKQNDWQAAAELTNNLKQFCPEDPVKYDVALFQMSLEKKFPIYNP